MYCLEELNCVNIIEMKPSVRIKYFCEVFCNLSNIPKVCLFVSSILDECNGNRELLIRIYQILAINPIFVVESSPISIENKELFIRLKLWGNCKSCIYNDEIIPGTNEVVKDITIPFELLSVEEKQCIQCFIKDNTLSNYYRKQRNTYLSFYDFKGDILLSILLDRFKIIMVTLKMKLSESNIKSNNSKKRQKSNLHNLYDKLQDYMSLNEDINKRINDKIEMINIFNTSELSDIVEERAQLYKEIQTSVLDALRGCNST